MSRVVAHLIVGAKPEPFLPAMLASIEPAVERIFVNENSGLGTDAPNLPALESSRLAQDGRMTIGRTAFTTFSDARNHCFQLDRAASLDTWIVFIDADEVHYDRFKDIAAKLERVPRSVGFIDDFTPHFFKSFDWYASIERRMILHRWTPQARWEGGVHERLAGIDGKRVALPYLHAHYGWVATFLDDARKGAHYSSLGGEGTPLSVTDAEAADFHGDYRAVERFFAEWWRKLMRFTGEHPASAQPIIADQRARKSKHFAQIDRIVRAHQPPMQRVANAIMKLNYEQRWRLRVLESALLGLP